MNSESFATNPARPRQFQADFVALPRDIFRGGLAGLICGIALFGVGGRAVMRVSAMLNPERRGFLTENGNLVGEITVGGTIELILFAGVFGGLLAGFIWVIVRDWLPLGGLSRLLVAGAAAACLGSFAVLTEENLDFRLLSPAWFHLTVFVLLIAIAGTAIALMDRLLEPILPRGRVAAAAYAVLEVPVGLVALAVLVQALLAPSSPLWVAAAALLVVFALDLATWRLRYFGGIAPGWLRPAGLTSVVIACAAASLHFVLEARDILNSAA